MSLTRPWKITIAVVVGLLLVLALYSGWLLWQVNKHLSAASDAAHGLQSAIKTGDEDQISAEFDAFADEASTAQKRTSGPVWSLLTHVPGFGDDAEGIQTVSQVADDLATGSLHDLANNLADLDGLAPQGGGIDLAKVEQLQTPVVDGAKEMDAARTELEAEDPSGYVESLKLKYRDLERQVRDAADALNAASSAVQVMPTMLGADGPKNYLLVVQNNAEVRSTGGLPGAVSVINATAGKLKLTKQVSGGSLGVADIPVLDLTNAESNAYGDFVGTIFLDANLQPDWARASDFMQARWQQVYGQKVDGVVSIDPIALSYILKVIGPVTVDGKQITGDNAVDQLLHQVYIDHPVPADQDAYFRRVAAAIFAQLTGPGATASALMPALSQGVHERRILVHSFDKSVDGVLGGTAISGDVQGLTDDPTYKPSTKPQIGVYFNEGSASKMSYYLKTDLKVTPTSCAGGVQTYAAHLTVTNTAAADEVKSLPVYVTGTGEDNPKGETLPIMQIYGPVDGSIGTVKISDNPDTYQTDITDDRRAIKQVFLELTPGETRDLTWTMKSGKGQTGATYLSMTPTVTPGTQSARLNSAC